MEGFLARRAADPRYASERRVDPFPSSAIHKSSYTFGTSYNSKGIHAKGSDADGDGKKGEGKGKKDFKDAEGNGKPDFMEGKVGDSDSDDEAPKKKKDSKGSKN